MFVCVPTTTSTRTHTRPYDVHFLRLQVHGSELVLWLGLRDALLELLPAAATNLFKHFFEMLTLLAALRQAGLVFHLGELSH